MSDMSKGNLDRLRAQLKAIAQPTVKLAAAPKPPTASPQAAPELKPALPTPMPGPPPKRQPVAPAGPQRSRPLPAGGKPKPTPLAMPADRPRPQKAPGPSPGRLPAAPTGPQRSRPVPAAAPAFKPARPTPPQPPGFDKPKPVQQARADKPAHPIVRQVPRPSPAAARYTIERSDGTTKTYKSEHRVADHLAQREVQRIKSAAPGLDKRSAAKAAGGVAKWKMSGNAGDVDPRVLRSVNLARGEKAFAAKPKAPGPGRATAKPVALPRIAQPAVPSVRHASAQSAAGHRQPQSQAQSARPATPQLPNSAPVRPQPPAFGQARILRAPGGGAPIHPRGAAAKGPSGAMGAPRVTSKLGPSTASASSATTTVKVQPAPPNAGSATLKPPSGGKG